MDKLDTFSVDRELHTTDQDRSDPFGIFHGTLRETNEGNFVFDYVGQAGPKAGPANRVQFSGTHRLDTTDPGIAMDRALAFDPFADPASAAASTGLRFGGPPRIAIEESRAKRSAEDQRQRAAEAHRRKVDKDLRVFDEMQPDLRHVRDTQERWDRLNFWRRKEYRERRARLDAADTAALPDPKMGTTWDSSGTMRTIYGAKSDRIREPVLLEINTAGVTVASLAGGIAANIVHASSNDPYKENAWAHQVASIGGLAGARGNPSLAVSGRQTAQQFSYNIRPQPFVPRTGAGQAPQAKLRAASKKPPLLSPAKPPPESFAGMAEAVFGRDARAAPRYIVTRDGTVLPDLPPVGNQVPVYMGNLSRGQLPSISLGQRQVAVGPVPDGLTMHEIFLPRTHHPRVSQTIRKMRSGAPQARGAQGEIFILEAAGPGAERGGSGVRNPFNGALRFPDVRQPTIGRQTHSYESKNYLRYRGVKGGGHTVHEVPLSTFIRNQVNNDAFQMIYGRGGYRPVWIFQDAPPSPALAEYLSTAGIPFVVYGDRTVR